MQPLKSTKAIFKILKKHFLNKMIHILDTFVNKNSVLPRERIILDTVIKL